MLFRFIVIEDIQPSRAARRSAKRHDFESETSPGIDHRLTNNPFPGDSPCTV